MTPHWRQTEWTDGLDRFAARLRSGETSAEATARRALDRIAENDGKVRSFVHVAPDLALADAHRVDDLLREGRDLGPLMGVPVGIKDLFAVEGMPTRAGSDLDVSHAIGPEGGFIARLRATGAVILGKTRTIEFAAGAQNVVHATPWNPADPQRHRSIGGSSNGSAAAVAAGFCPLAIGSDTGGSVRSPAALCGITGHKFSAGAFPLDGVFPLCHALDSVGILVPRPGDALIAAQALLGGTMAQAPKSVVGLHFGVPADPMLIGLDAPVASAFDAALGRLREAGAEIETLDWPGADELDVVARVFAGLVPSDLIGTLGSDLLASEGSLVDPVARHRMSLARRLDASAEAALAREAALLAIQTPARMADLDAILTPTAPLCAPLLDELGSVEASIAFTARALGLTRVANAFGMTACSVPITHWGEGLPVGMDVAAPGGSDLACIARASAVQQVVVPAD